MIGAVIPFPKKSLFQPSGIPLSNQLNNWDRNAWYHEPLQQALAAIDRVHGDGFWQEIRVSEAPDTPDDPWSAGFTATSTRAYLFYNENQSAGVFETFHELGHGIEDYGFIELGKHPSGHHSNFAAWRKAVMNSLAYQWLKGLQGKKSVVLETFIGKQEKPISQRDVNYYLLWRELLARSYAQYLGLVSGNQESLLRIASASNSSYRQVLYTSQWEEQDFEAIFIEIGNRKAVLYTRVVKMTQVLNQKVETQNSAIAYIDPADLRYSVEEMIALLVKGGESPREAKRQVIVARLKTEQQPTRVAYVDGQKIEFEVNY